MEQNEANRLNDDYDDLPEPLRPLALSCDRVIQDERAFADYLIELVYYGLRPSYAMWLHCRRFRVNQLVIGGLWLGNHPMVDVMEWIRVHFLQDVDNCGERLAELVLSGELRASQAVYAYCRHRGISKFTLVNLKRPHARRSKVVKFFDTVIPREFASFLDVVERERIAGRL